MQNQQLSYQVINMFVGDTNGCAIDRPAKYQQLISHPPSWPDGHSDLECDLLEHLDDVIFAAIAGNGEALKKARTLWPRVIDEHGWKLVAESRAQYLRCAIDAMAQVESQETDSLDQANMVAEVIELLTED
jgi:hypothetical protein